MASVSTYGLDRFSQNLKSDFKEIRRILVKENVPYFFHFTDWRNLTSIKNHGGLYSWLHCELNHIDIVLPGGNPMSRSLDRYYGTENYVKLSFCVNHPMSYRVAIEQRAELVLLAIDTRVAEWCSTLFTDLNSCDQSHHCGNDSAFLHDYVDFDAIHADYLRHEDPRFKLHQAEVMVHQHVPLEYIVNIDDPVILRF